MKIRKKSISVLLMVCALFFMWGSGIVKEPAGEKNRLNFSDAGELKAYMKWRPGKQGLISAHRGGPMPAASSDTAGFPENALETFDNALTYGPCLIECDVRICKDGKMVMMHDDTLDRTTTGHGLVSDHTLAALKRLYLKAPGSNKPTTYRIPTFGEVLRWAKGRTILTVDVKRGVPFERIVSEVRRNKAEGHAIIIVYNPKDLVKVHKLAPDLMISASAKGMERTRRMLDSGVPAENICAFVGVRLPSSDVFALLHKKGITTIMGTMHNLDNSAARKGTKVYKQLYEAGADVLSTANVPLVSKAIKEMAGQPAKKANEVDSGNANQLIVWSSGDKEVALKMVFMYALNSKRLGWMKRVHLLVWGPSSKLLANDVELQGKLAGLKAQGVELLACKACSDMYGISDKLAKLGITVKYAGKYLAEKQQNGWHVLTF
ncbi:MAG: hypothetical protein GY765_20635 [bacterium]|nr:hypothetical protein [bacterium]